MCVGRSESPTGGRGGQPIHLHRIATAKALRQRYAGSDQVAQTVAVSRGITTPDSLPQQQMKQKSACVVERVYAVLHVLTDTEQIRETLRKGLEFNSKAALPPISSQRQSHERAQ